MAVRCCCVRRLGLTAAVARRLGDPRQRGKLRHGVADLLRQRVFGIALGYEDLNDHAALRHDRALQAAAGRDRALASAATLCRFENRAEPGWAWAVHEVLAAAFIASFEGPPEEIVLDIDATDDAVHGRQEGRFFHGYYDRYCFLPLYVFAGGHLLVAYLRPADIDPAKHARAVLKLLVGRLRRAWPGVRIVVRADSGFCRWRLMSWCERHGVGYILGLAGNARLAALGRPAMALAEARFAASGLKQRHFAELGYGARGWDRDRRVIARIEHGPKGANPRFVVTNLAGDGRDLYERLYCARGEMENRIEEQQLQLFADRTSCHRWWPNQFRLLLASLAYTLLNAIRRRAQRDPPPRPRGHRHGPRPMRHHPPQAPEDRRRDHPQYKAGALPPVLRLPRAGPLPPGRRPAEARLKPDPQHSPVGPTPATQPATPDRARNRRKSPETDRQRHTGGKICGTKPLTPAPTPEKHANTGNLAPS